MEFQLKKGLTLKKRTIISIDFQTYFELLYDIYAEINTFSKTTKTDNHFVVSIIKTYNCYNDALAIWDKNSPDALIQNGIVTLHQAAERRFNYETVPILQKKWQECAYYLEEAKNIRDNSNR